MDRAHLAPHSVAVYKDGKDKDAATPHRVLNLVPYPYQGYDNYQVDGVMYPGFLDHGGRDACVILTMPLQPSRT